MVVLGDEVATAEAEEAEGGISSMPESISRVGGRGEVGEEEEEEEGEEDSLFSCIALFLFDTGILEGMTFRGPNPVTAGEEEEEEGEGGGGGEGGEGREGDLISSILFSPLNNAVSLSLFSSL